MGDGAKLPALAVVETPMLEDASADDAKLDDVGPAPLPAPMWAPLALLGALAAFFSVLGIAAVMRDARFTPPAPALLAGGLFGGLAGVVLRRWRRLHDPWLPQERQRVLIALVVGLTGALIGFVVVGYSAVEWGLSANTGWIQAGFGALSGVACSLLFIPGAVFIVAASARATRARHGSIVAAADRRSVWSTTLAAIAAAPVVAVPATAVGYVSFSLGRVLQPAAIVGATVLAAVALIVLEVIEIRARSVFERVVSVIDELEPAHDGDATGVQTRDLGLGEGGFSKLSLRDAYRGARHAEVALRGDPDEARVAFDEARSRRGRTRTLGVLAFLAALPAMHALWVSVERLEIDWDPTEVAGVFDHH